MKRVKKPTKAMWAMAEHLIGADNYSRNEADAAKWGEWCRRVAIYKQVNDAHPGAVQIINWPFDDYKGEFPGVYCEKMRDPDDRCSWGLSQCYVLGGVVIPEQYIQRSWVEAINEDGDRRIKEDARRFIENDARQTKEDEDRRIKEEEDRRIKEDEDRRIWREGHRSAFPPGRTVSLRQRLRERPSGWAIVGGVFLSTGCNTRG